MGKGGLHHYAFKERRVRALGTNQGAVIDESPERRRNQKATRPRRSGSEENGLLPREGAPMQRGGRTDAEEVLNLLQNGTDINHALVFPRIACSGSRSFIFLRWRTAATSQMTAAKGSFQKVSLVKDK